MQYDDKKKPNELTVISRRGIIGAAIVAPAAITLTPKLVRADLFGDVGVLLAQLEQQLQLVSHAISTVQNLVQTVEHLDNVRKQTLAVLKQAKSGGLDGILNALQGATQLAMGVTGNLARINSDATWWNHTVVQKLIGGDTTMSQKEMFEYHADLRQRDRDLIAEAQKTGEAYKSLKDASDSLQSSSTAAQEAMTQEGVVGNVQYVGRQVYQLHRATVDQATMTAMLVESNRQAEARMAAQREAARQAVEGHMQNLDVVTPSGGVELPYGVQSGWQ